MELTVFEDIFYGAVASMGFATISNLARKQLLYCGAIAGLGHCIRFVLLNYVGMILGSFIAALFIGCISIAMAGKTKSPAECLSFPALLPMIPGMYAYNAVQALIACLSTNEEKSFMHETFLLNYNLLATFVIIFMMVVGIAMPIYVHQRYRKRKNIN